MFFPIYLANLDCRPLRFFRNVRNDSCVV